MDGTTRRGFLRAMAAGALRRAPARGMLFRNAHCAAPMCNPSRTAILTGLRPTTSGVYNNRIPPRSRIPDAVTLPRHFRAHGYRTIGGGKIFHFRDPASWDEYHPRAADPVPAKRPVNGIPRAAHFDWGPLDAGDEAMGDHKLVEWAAERLKARYDRPFFLACGFVKPHLPWYVPRRYFDVHPAEEVTLPRIDPHDLDDIPEIGRRIARPGGDHARVLAHGQWRRAVAAYLAAGRFLDAEIGRLLDALDRGPHARNTVIVWWSDHGWHLGEKLHWRKFALWEESTHCPLGIAAPGRVRPGSVCDHAVSLLDIFPTLADLCGLPAREGLDAGSLVPLLEDPGRPWDRPAVTTLGFMRHAVRTDRWRYMRYEDGYEELYDHEKDPREWTNLGGREAYAEVKARLAARLPRRNARPPARAPRRRRKGAGRNAAGRKGREEEAR